MDEALYLKDPRARSSLRAWQIGPGPRLKIIFEMLQLKPVCRFRYRRPHSHQAARWAADGGPAEQT